MASLLSESDPVEGVPGRPPRDAEPFARGCGLSCRLTCDVYETQYELCRVVRLMAPTRNHYVVFGDGMFQACLKGNAPGLGGRIFRQCILQLQPNQILAQADEYRTTKLDPNAHAVMVNPVGPPKRDRRGRVCVHRVWGHKLCVLGDYSMRWARDISASLNMMRNFYYALVHGVQPWAFLRSTPPEALLQSADWKYIIRQGRFYRRPAV